MKCSLFLASVLYLNCLYQCTTPLPPDVLKSYPIRPKFGLIYAAAAFTPHYSTLVLCISLLVHCIMFIHHSKQCIPEHYTPYVLYTECVLYIHSF